LTQKEIKIYPQKLWITLLKKPLQTSDKGLIAGFSVKMFKK